MNSTAVINAWRGLTRHRQTKQLVFVAAALVTLIATIVVIEYVLSDLYISGRVHEGQKITEACETENQFTWNDKQYVCTPV